ncbi:MAG: DUF5043 domain-containing protein [Dysgonamonadaceae bacterium]|jgi:hypothetical protein|nr:DUF5043 domain-containing protein [Dysgonamonadaceae bacterium]
MKTKHLFLIILLLGVSKIAAQTYYYNETKTFSENGYTYQCDKASYWIVTLYNKANQYTYSHYERKDGNPIGNIEDLLPLIEDDNWTRQKCISIVNNAFSSAEKQRVKGAKVDVSMTVDTSTGKVIEVDFGLYYNTPEATIPVSTYRNLELALKNQIWFTLTDNGKKLKFIQRGWMHEIE